jgi:hypothetical protein
MCTLPGMPTKSGISLRCLSSFRSNSRTAKQALGYREAICEREPIPRRLDYLYRTRAQ